MGIGMRFRLLAVALSVAASAISLTAQPQPRRATTIAAIRAYPGFYHQQTVLVVGEVKGTVERATIGTDEGAITLIARELPRESRIEARGQLLDLGRMSQDDPRLIPFNLLDRTRAAYQDRWPKPGEELILMLGGTCSAARRRSMPRRRRCARWRWSRRGSKDRRSRSSDSSAAAICSASFPRRRRRASIEFVLRSGDAARVGDRRAAEGQEASTSIPASASTPAAGSSVQGTVRTARGLTWLEGTSIELAPAPRRNHRGRDRSAAATAGRDSVYRARGGRSRRAARRSASACSCRAISIRRR